MTRFWTELLCIAWPWHRRRVDAHRGWCKLLNAGLYLSQRPDYDKGDLAAGRIISIKLRELNGR